MKSLDNIQKDRLKKICIKIGTVLLVGVLYFAFVKIFHIGIPCLIKLVTKKYCPGCGIRRMCFALANFDCLAAFRYNALLMCLLPFALVYGGKKIYTYVMFGNTDDTKFEKIALIIIFVITVAFWIMRNTQTFSYLAPTSI